MRWSESSSLVGHVDEPFPSLPVDLLSTFYLLLANFLVFVVVFFVCLYSREKPKRVAAMDHPCRRKSDDLGFVPIPKLKTPGGATKPDSLLMSRPRPHQSGFKKPEKPEAGFRFDGGFDSRFSGKEKVNPLTGVPSGGVMEGSKGFRSDDTKQFDQAPPPVASQREFEVNGKQAQAPGMKFSQASHNMSEMAENLQVNRFERPDGL